VSRCDSPAENQARLFPGRRRLRGDVRPREILGPFLLCNTQLQRYKLA